MELINHEVSNADKCATTKQRRFYHILAGKKAPKRIRAIALDALIKREFSPKQIDAARLEFKMRKGANKYQRRIAELLLNRTLKKGERLTRREALRIINEASVRERREAIRTWRVESLKAEGGILK